METITAQPAPAAAPRPKHKGSAQLFKNPVLERLSHTHIALPVSIFIATALVSLYYGITRGFVSGLSGLGLFLGGLLLPIGSPPNLIGRELIEEETGEPLTFAEWFLVALPKGPLEAALGF